MFTNRQQHTQPVNHVTPGSSEGGEAEGTNERPSTNAEIRIPGEDVVVRRGNSSIPRSTPSLPTGSPITSINQGTSLVSTPVKGEKPDQKRADQKLVVGPDIHLKGEVSNCGTLVVEGHVEGSAKSQLVHVAEGGAFEGDLEVATAEISGNFEGTLTVSKQLNISSTGKVVGTIRYAEIHIDAGGQISGDIQVMPGE